jgi:hypothetical protein
MLINKSDIYNTGRKIIYPKIDFILNNIQNNNYFTFSKISTDWWSLFKNTLVATNTDIKDINIIQSVNFADAMVNEWIKHNNNKTDWVVTSKVIFDVINYITSPIPENFVFSFTDRTPGGPNVFNKKNIFKYPDLNKGRQKFVLDLILKIKDKDTQIFDGMCWKYWAATDELNKIINVANKNDISIILLAPFYFNNFGEIFNVKKFHTYNLHESKASLFIDKYEKEIIELDKTIPGSKIYLLQAGGPAMWLTCKLHNKLNNSYIFDIGRAIDIYYRFNNKLMVSK